ncbi:MAG TPA: GYF domain-containing protein [Candidatus Methylacidiphilales bacterium]|nr:GYF domain-containing protein [Candidatus Methylacidiphilales bacterium]
MKQVGETFPQMAASVAWAGQKVTIYRDAARLGEWSEMDVRNLYADGLLLATDYCWREGMKEWQLLDRFANPGPRRKSVLFC